MVFIYVYGYRFLLLVVVQFQCVKLVYFVTYVFTVLCAAHKRLSVVSLLALCTTCWRSREQLCYYCSTSSVLHSNGCFQWKYMYHPINAVFRNFFKGGGTNAPILPPLHPPPTLLLNTPQPIICSLAESLWQYTSKD